MLRSGLTLALFAGLVAVTRGDDHDAPKNSWNSNLWPGNWFAKKVPEAQKDNNGERVSESKVDVNAAQRLQAELDWKRRAAVCQKLRQIAFETHDEELDRFADRLDQRAWDAYVRRMGANPGGSGLSTEERVLGERIGVDVNQLRPSTRTPPRKTPTSQEDRP